MNKRIDPENYIKRPVTLTPGWYRQAFTPFLLKKREDATETVLAYPKGLLGYVYFDAKSGSEVSVNKKNADMFLEEAVSLYKKFPQGKLTLRDLLIFRLSQGLPRDYFFLALLSMAVSALALLAPVMTRILTGEVVNRGSMTMLLGIGFCMMAVSLASAITKMIQSLLSHGIEAKGRVITEAAAYDRLLDLPLSFFRDHPSGELMQRLSAVSECTDAIARGAFVSLIGTLGSLIYLVQIHGFAPELTLPAFVIIAVTFFVSLFSSRMKMKQDKRIRLAAAAEETKSIDIIKGISKLKLSNAGKGAYLAWKEKYEKLSLERYDPPVFLKIYGPLLLGLRLFGAVIMYYLAYENGVEVPDYLAFNVAYGGLMGAFASLSDTVLSIIGIKPVYEMAAPIMESITERNDKKRSLDDISGEVELRHVSFSYDKKKKVIDDISLHVCPGDYLAITGESGSGKTTLIRLILGLEKPDSGQVLYDGVDIETLDMRSVRKFVGAVIQDGSLFTGDILMNITIGDLSLSEEDAWRAAETAAIADDIKAIPTGMYSAISGHGGNISGGQRQRLLIARAIVSDPRILILDEATSALDSQLQSKVTASIDSMGMTRIVAAHRLSTIKKARTIIHIESGRIAEQGSFNELMAMDTAFAKMVKMQL